MIEKKKRGRIGKNNIANDSEKSEQVL